MVGTNSAPAPPPTPTDTATTRPDGTAGALAETRPAVETALRYCGGTLRPDNRRPHRTRNHRRTRRRTKTARRRTAHCGGHPNTRHSANRPQTGGHGAKTEHGNDHPCGWCGGGVRHGLDARPDRHDRLVAGTATGAAAAHPLDGARPSAPVCVRR